MVDASNRLVLSGSTNSGIVGCDGAMWVTGGKKGHPPFFQNKLKTSEIRTGGKLFCHNLFHALGDQLYPILPFWFMEFL